MKVEMTITKSIIYTAIIDQEDYNEELFPNTKQGEVDFYIYLREGNLASVLRDNPHEFEEQAPKYELNSIKIAE